MKSFFLNNDMNTSIRSFMISKYLNFENLIL